MKVAKASCDVKDDSEEPAEKMEKAEQLDEKMEKDEQLAEKMEGEGDVDEKAKDNTGLSFQWYCDEYFRFNTRQGWEDLVRPIYDAFDIAGCDVENVVRETYDEARRSVHVSLQAWLSIPMRNCW